jgi:signal transduction histidine kinase
MAASGQPSLAEFIESRRHEIVAVLTRQASAAVAVDAMRAPELVDTLPGFLEDLAEVLRQRAGDPGKFAMVPASQTPIQHGSERFEQGMNVTAVVREYGFLYDSLYECLDRENLSPEAWEQRTVSQCIIAAISQSVAQHGIERDEALRKQASGHIAFLAHELRNPLASVRMGWSLLQRAGTLPEARFVDVIERGLKKLGRLVDESLIEMKLVSAPAPERERIALDQFIADVAAESESDA